MRPLLICLFIVLTPCIQSQNGIAPIPPAQLYGCLFDQMGSDCNTAAAFRQNYTSCIKKGDIFQDYACRYLRSECYCCGYKYESIENGEICTKFCSIGSYAELKRLCTFMPKHKSCRRLTAEKAKQSSIPRKYGERGLIILPFNWGGPAGPERITDGLGREVDPSQAKLDNGCGEVKTTTPLSVRRTTTLGKSSQLVANSAGNNPNVNTKRRTTRRTTTMKNTKRTTTMKWQIKKTTTKTTTTTATTTPKTITSTTMTTKRAAKRITTKRTTTMSPRKFEKDNSGNPVWAT